MVRQRIWDLSLGPPACIEIDNANRNTRRNWKGSVIP
jgi:hypothetical protein